MSNISQWSTSAASNNFAPPDGFPEGQAPSTVNDCSRELMAAIARQFLDTDGSLVTGGAGNAYALTTNNANALLADQGLILFRADRANTGAATLNVDTLGAKNLQANGANVAAGDIVANSIYAVVYNATNDTYEIVNAKLNRNAISALYFNLTIKRLEVLADGTVDVLSDGDTDAENRRIQFTHSDGTARAQVGQIGDDILTLANLINSGNLTLVATNAAAASRTLIDGDPDGGVSINHPASNQANLQTVTHDAADNSSGANVRGADGTLRGIGYNSLPVVAVSGADHTVALADQGRSLFYNEATARSILFNNDADIPVNAYGHIRVGPTAGTCTLDGGTGVTLTFYDGVNYTTTAAAGNVQIADGSYTWWKESDTSYYIDGPNIVAA